MPTRASVAGILSVCLLLLSSLGATGVLAGARPPQAATPQVKATIIGTGSCVGIDACLEASGPIGDNACNGDYACESATGSVGDNSCDNFAACHSAGGNIGTNSCTGFEGCDGIAGSVGDNSCTGDAACYYAEGSVGNNSCNGSGPICESASGTIGDCAYNDIVPAVCEIQPDARIRRAGGNSHGNDIYNSDGTDQTVGSVGTVGSTLTFRISIQNDGNVDGAFTVKRSGFFQDGYKVRYYNAAGADVTGQVNSGSFTTPSLSPGADYVVHATVKIRSLARVCSSVTRLLTVSSVNNPSLKDAVGFEVASLPLCP